MTYQKARLTIAELFEHGQHHARYLKWGTSSGDDAAVLRVEPELDAAWLLLLTTTATITDRCRHDHRIDSQRPARRPQHDLSRHLRHTEFEFVSSVDNGFTVRDTFV